MINHILAGLNLEMVCIIIKRDYRFHIYEYEKIFLFDRNTRLLEKTDTRYAEINNIIKKINSVSEPEILLETNNLKYLKTVIDILKDTGFDDAFVVKVNKTYQLWKNLKKQRVLRCFLFITVLVNHDSLECANFKIFS